MPKKLTREQAAIIGAFTGIAAGPFEDIHGYAENIMGRPIWTHEFGSKATSKALREAARDDFMALCPDRSMPAPEEPHDERT